jgi:hypothetical protein
MGCRLLFREKRFVAFAASNGVTGLRKPLLAGASLKG